MSTILSAGQKITLDNGDKLVVDSLLGVGGQGEVYKVNMNGNHYALKMYIDKEDTNKDFIYNLKNNITKGSPSSRFLWPKAYIEYNGCPGYLMDLRAKNYESLVSYLNGKTKFKNKRIMLEWCIKLVQSFKQLHEKGYSYQDLNDGSFFLDPNSGDLLICDNDNVTADKKNLGVLGKMKYMAPEIVTGNSLPDIHSDRFSLAVILFMVMTLGRPYEGERLKDYDFIGEEAEYELYGTKPLFVYHKTDKSNRPIRGYHESIIKRWPLLPTYIKEAFHRTFVDGLVDRENERTTEFEWIKLINRYLDELITCPNCGEQYAFGFSEPNHRDKCPYCNKEGKTFTVLHLNKSLIALEIGKNLYQTHIDKYSSEYSNIVATIVQNKTNPSLWGIKLFLNNDVYIKDSSGNEKIIPGNGVIPIVNNLKIKFNDETIAQIEKYN